VAGLLKIGFWNVEGLRSKIGSKDFVHVLSEHNTFGITESWGGFEVFEINLYRPNGTTSVPANVLLFGRAVQRLYRCIIPLFKAPSKHKFKIIVLFECLEFFYWLLRLSEIDF
jgi:hypothetical protein